MARSILHRSNVSGVQQVERAVFVVVMHSIAAIVLSGSSAGTWPMSALKAQDIYYRLVESNDFEDIFAKDTIA